ncbi:MAG: porin [Hyphomicrobium sp.]|nr:porin [Hyphomicrobium sp.]
MTTLSRISMAAVAALIVGMGPASAADLGGNCCADLEERVAELEATTARKGTRKVSVTISGQISQQLMFWDDGIQKDMYISGPAQSNSRWRITGSAKISPAISAGFIYEFEAFRSGSTSQNQSNGPGPGNTVRSSFPVSRDVGDDGGASSANLREAMAWIEHERLGRVSLGAGSSAANNIILVDLSGKGMAASNDVRLMNSGFRVRTVNNISGGANPYATVGNRTWANFFQGGQDWLNERNQHIQYRTPTIAGFTLGASFGEDNYWDVALRYAGEFNGVRVAAGIGYSVRSEYNATAIATGLNGATSFAAGGGGFICTINCEKEVKQLAGSASIRHMPTGLFFTGAAGQRDDNNFDTFSTTTGLVTSTRSFDSSFYYLSGGVARNFFGIGDTVLFGEYSQWKGMGQEYVAVGGDSKVEHWGIGILQNVDAAAMEFWLTYKNYSLSAADFCNAGGRGGCRDLDYVLAGTRIRF